ncbi:MAG: hypothetical protein HY017_11170 [Betaproteobacteria bacterium]|nr:hypothetical protein [Betaproteobacteria bacterium]
MAVCGCTSGMLFWKKPCDRIALDTCAGCGTALCASHVRRPKPGRFYCPECASEQSDSDTDSDSDSSSSSTNWFSDRSGNSDGERTAAAAASSSWFSSSDSGGSDSSSSDSGGGDSGGSSSD